MKELWGVTEAPDFNSATGIPLVLMLFAMQQPFS